MAILAELEALLAPVAQQHLLQDWTGLTSAQQALRAAQIQAIDFTEFAKLRHLHGTQTKSTENRWHALASRALPPQAIRLGESSANFSRQEARERGEAALRSGEVGMILVAGGLGTRLEFPDPKGMFPLGPISQRTLFQILIDQLRAVSKYYGVAIPLYVMTSPATHAKTAEYFQKTQNCGLAADQIRLFEQGTMYSVNACTFDILRDKQGIFLGPDGHGGMLAALHKQGHLAEIQARNIQTLFYGQIDNPLLTVCDAEFIGSHLLANSELTTQAVAKVQAAEKVGVLAQINGKTQIIEYVDLPQSMSEARLPNGSLKFWAGNTAVHAFNVAFLNRMTELADALPYHISLKKVPYVDSQGNWQEPAEPNAYRFEKFIFDLLPQAMNALVMEVDKAEAFYPVKNKDSAGVDTPTTARHAIIAQARKFLTSAGIHVAENIAVEVNPLWAMTSAQVREKLPSATNITTNTYFV
jgi:UDP-N-acetylglucosamine/UDP-N-acetylgalactosamine diphosphorylase